MKREPLRVDPAYYHSFNSNYSKFADAVMDVGPAPCTRYDCPRQKKCAEEAVECFAFRIWVNNGGKLNAKQQKKIGAKLLPVK